MCDVIVALGWRHDRGGFLRDVALEIMEICYPGRERQTAEEPRVFSLKEESRVTSCRWVHFFYLFFSNKPPPPAVRKLAGTRQN